MKNPRQNVNLSPSLSLKACFLFVLACICCFLPVSSYAETRSYACENPPWPIEPLTRQEREARWRLLTDLHTFKLQSYGRKISDKKCNSLLSQIISFEALEVLEPEGDWRNGAVLEIGKQCPDLKLNRGQRYSTKRTACEGRECHSFEAEATYLEYYNLSKYFDDAKSIWGFFGDGVELKCVSENCPPRKRQGSYAGPASDGYSRFRGVMGGVLNGDTCQRTFVPWLEMVQRLIPAGNSHYPCEVFRDTLNFAAFVEISGQPYIIAWIGFGASRNLSTIKKAKGHIYLLPILGDEGQIAETDLVCFYSSVNSK